MRVVMLTDNRFWRESMGSQVRIAALARHLLQAGHDLHVIFQGSLSPADASAVRAWPGGLKFTATRVAGSGHASTVATAPQPMPRASPAKAPSTQPRPGWRALARHGRYIAWALWAWLRCPQPRQWTHLLAPLRLACREPSVLELYTKADRAAFVAAVQAAAPAVLLVQYVRLVPLLDALPRHVRARLRVLVDTHDVQGERRLRFHAQGEAHDFKISDSEEALLLRRCDVVMAIHDTDRQKLRSLAGPVPVIRVGHPVPLRARCGPWPDPDRILFMGSNMAPNREAVAYLLDEVWPALQGLGLKAFPLTVAGGICDAFADRSLPPGVVLAGFVQDAGRLYDTHGIVAAPVLSGGGLKLKVAEALAAGAAVVATPLATEGLEHAVRGGALLIASGPVAFASALVALLADKTHAQRLGRSAEEWAASHLSIAGAFTELNSVLESKCQTVSKF